MDWNAAGAVGEIMDQFNACNQLYATDATIRKVLLKDEALYSGSVRDVGVALSRWPNMRQPRLGNSTGLFHGHGW